MNGLSANISPLIEKRTIRAIGRIVRFSLYRVSRATECSTSRTVRNCPHAGQAVPRALRQRGYYREQKLRRKFMFIGSRCKPIATPARAPRMRSLQRYKRCGASHAPPRARGRRPRRAVDERFISKHKPAHRETNDSRHWTNRSFLFLSHSRATECSTSRTVQNCPHAGRAVPSGTPPEGYYREQMLCRKFMSIGSRCKPIAAPHGHSE